MRRLQGSVRAAPVLLPRACCLTDCLALLVHRSHSTHQLEGSLTARQSPVSDHHVLAGGAASAAPRFDDLPPEENYSPAFLRSLKVSTLPDHHGGVVPEASLVSPHGWHHLPPAAQQLLGWTPLRSHWAPKDISAEPTSSLSPSPTSGVNHSGLLSEATHREVRDVIPFVQQAATTFGPGLVWYCPDDPAPSAAGGSPLIRTFLSHCVAVGLMTAEDSPIFDESTATAARSVGVNRPYLARAQLSLLKGAVLNNTLPSGGAEADGHQQQQQQQQQQPQQRQKAYNTHSVEFGDSGGLSVKASSFHSTGTTTAPSSVGLFHSTHGLQSNHLGGGTWEREFAVVPAWEDLLVVGTGRAGGCGGEEGGAPSVRSILLSTSLALGPRRQDRRPMNLQLLSSTTTPAATSSTRQSPSCRGTSSTCRITVAEPSSEAQYGAAPPQLDSLSMVGEWLFGGSGGEAGSTAADDYSGAVPPWTVAEVLEQVVNSNRQRAMAAERRTGDGLTMGNTNNLEQVGEKPAIVVTAIDCQFCSPPTKQGAVDAVPLQFGVPFVAVTSPIREVRLADHALWRERGIGHPMDVVAVSEALDATSGRKLLPYSVNVELRQQRRTRVTAAVYFFA